MGIATPRLPPISSHTKPHHHHSIPISNPNNSMAQDYHLPSIFAFSNNCFERPDVAAASAATDQDQQHHVAQQICRDKLRVQGYNPPPPPQLVGMDEEPGGLPTYGTTGMLSEMIPPAQFTWVPDGSGATAAQLNNPSKISGAAVMEDQGLSLSLSLSSSLQNLGAAKAEELLIGDSGLLFFNQAGGGGPANSSASASAAAASVQYLHQFKNSGVQNLQSHHHQVHVGYGSSPSSSSLGFVNVLRNSRYRNAAQELLEEICSVGRGQFKKGKFGRNTSSSNPSSSPSNNNNSSAGAVGGGASSSSSKDVPPLSAAERMEHQRRKVKLLSMLDELETRYNHYCEQLQMMANMFDLVLGYGAAAPYITLARKTISRQFRCLWDATAAQLKHSCELLGEKDGTGGSGITKGEMPRLKLLDQSLRQQRAWQPQRGLPERSIDILRAGLFEHFLHPYPSDADKHLLARQTGLSRNQSIANRSRLGHAPRWIGRPLLQEESISDQPLTNSVGSPFGVRVKACPPAGEDQKEVKPFIGIDLLHTKAGYVANKGSLLSDLKEEENATISSEVEKLEAMQKQRAESDLVLMENARDTETELFPWLVKKDTDPQAEEVKQFFGIDLLHTKAGYVANKGSLLSDLKEEENATVSSEAEKLEAMQKQRTESDLVSMENTRDTETELFPWLVKKEADPHAALEEVHSYSSYSGSELGSHCSESESEDTDKKRKIEASPEYHERETSESVVLHMRNHVEPEVEPSPSEENKDTASEEVHSYSSGQESEVDSYSSGPEYEDGDKKARIEASPEYNDIMHIPKMQKESSPQATLDITDATIGMLGGGGKQDGRPSEGWGAINYNSIVNHLIKSIKKSNIGKIGIYGRNEVGKAFVIEALKESAVLRNLFDRVICVTVPLNCDMEKLQKEIVGQISSDLAKANVVDMPHLAVNAMEGLKFLLILVGINQHMKLETLRIPDSTPVGSTMIFVAGSGQVCDEIEVDEKICLDDLLLRELFRQNVGEVVYHPKKVLAREIVTMCRPYSHAVILVARALQNVDDILIWKRALERLSVRPASHEVGIEALMVNVLRFSIDQLEDDKTRRCLKNLALCNDYHEIASESTISLWVSDGIVETHDEGQKVLKNLVNANLLEVDEKRQFVKFQDQDQDILVNLIFQPEENCMFLMRGGLDLIEPPKIEEWESAKEICLMHTGISELPKEPRCPSLSSLYLQRNYKLRKLSSSFFNQMPALEVLNLSRTRIRCLPESISQLVSLKRLFLNDCVLLRSISPAIGRLKKLEVFDLEGTKITNLPKEIECLVNLTCLGISTSGTEPSNDSKTVIPYGLISALLNLEELYLDVDPDAEWWDTCAEAIVSEVCNLKRLSTIKFCFPTLELLRHFNQLRKSMGHPSLAQFRFLVGNHANRIMNRLPSDIELELERCERYLRYINGDGVLTDIEDILQQSDAFFLERHANLKTLSELGIDSMEQLKWCVLGECNELEVLIDASDAMRQEALTESHCKSICLESLEFLYVYYMKNLRNIWKGSVQKGCLSSLKVLKLRKCPELTVIFSCEMLDNLNNLEEVTVEDCPAIKSLISCETSTGKVRETSYFLPMLKKLSLHYVPQLSSMSCGLRIAPRLERLSFYDCPSLKSLSTDEVSSEHLKKIRGERSWWKDLEWRGHKPEHLDGIFVPIDTCDVP